MTLKDIFDGIELIRRDFTIEIVKDEKSLVEVFRLRYLVIPSSVSSRQGKADWKLTLLTRCHATFCSAMAPLVRQSSPFVLWC